MQEIFEKYAKNAPKFAVSASSQANETLKKIMPHRAPKSICYSLSESSDIRFESAVAAKNEDQRYMLYCREVLGLYQGHFSRLNYNFVDLKKEKKRNTAKMPSTKIRRHFCFGWICGSFGIIKKEIGRSQRCKTVYISSISQRFVSRLFNECKTK